jgi:hypothetical protein
LFCGSRCTLPRSLRTTICDGFYDCQDSYPDQPALKGLAHCFFCGDVAQVNFRRQSPCTKRCLTVKSCTDSTPQRGCGCMLILACSVSCCVSQNQPFTARFRVERHKKKWKCDMYSTWYLDFILGALERSVTPSLLGLPCNVDPKGKLHNRTVSLLAKRSFSGDRLGRLHWRCGWLRQCRLVPRHVGFGRHPLVLAGSHRLGRLCS